MSPRVPPAFPYEDGLPLDLGPHGALGPRDDVFGDLCAAPVGAPWKRLEAPVGHRRPQTRWPTRPGFALRPGFGTNGSRRP
jgi:hypothetical protein